MKPARRQYLHLASCTALALAVSGVFQPGTALAQDAAKQLVGTWQVTGFSTRFLDNNEVVRVFGDRVSGYIQYMPGGHMVTFMVGGDRKAPAAPSTTDAERAALYNGIFAGYAGTYSVDGNKVIHRIVASWNEAFTGTEQTRYFELDGKKLTITTAPNVNLRTGRLQSSTFTFEKLE